MRVVFYIDGENAYEKYGVFVRQYGYKDLVSMPKLKKVETNEWAEQDGIEADLSAPELDTRTLSIDFFGTDIEMCIEFIEAVSDGAYHTFNFPEIDRTYKLRIASESSKTIFIKTEKFALKFSDDFPLLNYEYVAPIEVGVRPQKYLLDDVNFAVYGVQFLDGTDASILKSPNVKTGLVVNNSDMSGAIYGGKKLAFKTIGAEEEEEEETKIDVFFKAKDATMKCLINTSLANFWRNYNALFYNLVKPNARMLYIDRLNDEYKCYYKSSKVSKFDVLSGGRVWCEFTITLCFMDFRCAKFEHLLASEDGALILAEDGITLIDMRYYGNN